MTDMTDMTGATDLCRMTPEQLLARVAQGDRAALDALYDGTAARLYAVCVALLEDRIEAEETLEETFLAIWRDAGAQPGSGLEAMAWLGAVACDRAGLRIAMRDAPAARRGGAGRPGPDRLPPDPGMPDPQMPDPEMPDRGLAGAVAAADHGNNRGDNLGAGRAGAGHGGPDRAGGGAGGARSGAAAGGHRPVDGRAFAPHAALVRELVPVMPPARARRRIRERLGHVAAPLSEVIDSRIRWWQRPWGVLTAAVALAVLVLVGAALLRPGRPDSAAAGTATAETAITASQPAPTPTAPSGGHGMAEAAAPRAPDAGRVAAPR